MNDTRRPPQTTDSRSQGAAVRYPIQVRATFVRLPRQPAT
jgi:hypothetical protein